MELGIPKEADPKAKVFNPNYLPWEELSEDIIILNHLPTLALAKSISSFLCTKVGLYYTEVDVVDMLLKAIRVASSDEMMHLLLGNHIAWCTHRYTLTGEMEPDVEKQFHAQDSPDFYVKDIGTIMPSILYCLVMLGQSPVNIISQLTYDLWGIGDVASALLPMMKRNQKVS